MQPEMLKKVIISWTSSGTVSVWVSPGRLEDIVARVGDPVMLQIAPAALEHEAVHRRGMAVAREDAGLAHPQQVAPLAVQRVEHQRPEPDRRAPAAPRPARRRAWRGRRSRAARAGASRRSSRSPRSCERGERVPRRAARGIRNWASPVGLVLPPCHAKRRHATTATPPAQQAALAAVRRVRAPRGRPRPDPERGLPPGRPARSAPTSPRSWSARRTAAPCSSAPGSAGSPASSASSRSAPRRTRSTAHALATDEPVISPDLAREKRFKVAALRGRPRGQGAGQRPDPRRRRQAAIRHPRGRQPRGRGRSRETDTDFLRTYANLLADAIERIRILRELRSAAGGQGAAAAGAAAPGQEQPADGHQLRPPAGAPRAERRGPARAAGRRPPDRDAEPGLREALRHGRRRARRPRHLSRRTRAPPCCGSTPRRRRGCACAPRSRA